MWINVWRNSFIKWEKSSVWAVYRSESAWWRTAVCRSRRSPWCCAGRWGWTGCWDSCWSLPYSRAGPGRAHGYWMLCSHHTEAREGRGQTKADNSSLVYFSVCQVTSLFGSHYLKVKCWRTKKRFSDSSQRHSFSCLYNQKHILCCNMPVMVFRFILFSKCLTMCKKQLIRFILDYFHLCYQS